MAAIRTLAILMILLAAASMANVVQVVLRPVRVIDVKTVGGSEGASDLTYYQNWLELDAGNPFSRYSEKDVVSGGSPSDS